MEEQMKNNRLFLVIGQFSLGLGILGFISNYIFLNNNLIIAFVSGLLLGLTFVMNLAYLLKIKKS